VSSVIIIGKGPSTTRCTKYLVDSYDEVAICGHPVYKGYVHLISDHADYDFCNVGDIEPYVVDLGIKYVFNTGGPGTENRKPVEGLIPPGATYVPNLSASMRRYFRDEYDLDSATGTYTLECLLRMNKYDEICMVGFDLMQVGEPIYYFKKDEVKENLLYLFSNGTYTPDGVRIKKSDHNTEKTFEYMVDKFKQNEDIKFSLLTNYEPFKKVAEELENVEIL
tara:strand:- start:1169 stop:1834 length:666 start_codon:yes stop_codon:yes gene_type:complete